MKQSFFHCGSKPIEAHMQEQMWFVLENDLNLAEISFERGPR